MSIALVAGAAGGIGAAVATRLAAGGWQAVPTARSRLAEVEALTRQTGARAVSSRIETCSPWRGVRQCRGARGR